MNDSVLERQKTYIRSILDRDGIDATELARRAGIAPSTLNRPLNDPQWPHKLSKRTMKKIAEASGHPLPKDIAAGQSGFLSDISELGEPVDLTKGFPPQPEPPAYALIHINVLGITVGGGAGDGGFHMNGDVVQRVPCPASLANIKGVFALYVQGDSMAHRYNHGEMILATDSIPAQPGDHVVVELYPDHDGEGGPCYIKQLRRRTTKELVLFQYHPEKEIRLPMSKVKAIYRIFTVAELVRA